MRLRKKKEKTPVPAKTNPGAKPDEARTGAQPSTQTAPSGGRPKPGDRRLINIGKSIRIKGELSGNEDITVDGTVEGTIDLKGHNLTIGPNGRITADVFAKNVQVIGKVLGDVTAADRVEVTEGGTVEGDIHAPRVSLADGAKFSGKIDMLGKTPARATTPGGMPTSTGPGKPTSWQPKETPTAQDDLFDEESAGNDDVEFESGAKRPAVSVTERQMATSMKPSPEDWKDTNDTSRGTAKTTTDTPKTDTPKTDTTKTDTTKPSAKPSAKP